MEILPLKAFADNYIWLLRNGGRAAIIDPGEAQPVLEHLQTTGERLFAILITHHHRDHTGGIADLLAARALHAQDELPVFGPAIEHIPGINRPLNGGETVTLPELNARLDVLAIAGHTRGHLAYFCPPDADYRAGALFCGDTLFPMGCGRLFEGTPAQMHAALARLAALDPTTEVYCAHEYTASGLRFAATVEPDNAALAARRAHLQPLIEAHQPTVPFRLADELATNPFLRLNEAAVQIAIQSRLGHPPRDALETFAALRHWRDHF